MRGELGAEIAAALLRVAHARDELGEDVLVQAGRWDDDALVGERGRVGREAPGLAAADVSRDQASRSALLLALGAAVGFASWYLLIDQVADEGRLWVLIASRGASSVLLVAIVLATKARDGIPGLRPVLPFVVTAGILDVGANVFFVLARGDISVALAATISGLYPLFTMTLARLFLGERLPRLGFLAVVMAVAGTVLISVAR